MGRRQLEEGNVEIGGNGEKGGKGGGRKKEVNA